MKRSAIAGVIAVSGALAAAPRADVLGLLHDGGAELKPLGTAGGLAGWHVTPAGGAPYTLYVSASGHAVVGLLYDADGALVTADQLAAITNPPPVTASSSAAPAPARPALTTGGFAIGGQGPRLRVFADPACPWSRTAVAEFAAEALAGRIVLEVVPVALLGAGSARLALGAVAGGAEAWFARAVAEPDAALAAAVSANNARFDEAGGTAVPLLVWQASDGAIRTRTGMPASVHAFLEEISR